MTSYFSVIDNKSYSEAVSNMSRLHRLKQNHPLDTAIFNIEYVIETGGAENLRTESHNLAWYQYFLIDSILLICFTLLGAVFLQRQLTRFISQEYGVTKLVVSAKCLVTKTAPVVLQKLTPY